MKINKISVKSLFAIAFIFACTTIAWFILGETLSQRTSQHCKTSGTSVEQIWGPIQKQVHPLAWYQSPTGKQGKSYIQPESSNINVDLSYEPKRKGLLWHRTYLTSFSGNYKIPNPTPIAQTIYITFPLPAENTSFHKFSFKLGGNDNSNQTPKNGFITQAITIPANASVPLEVSYQSRGTGKWEYSLGTINRVRNFHLRMLTNFNDIDFPEGSSSPSKRTSNPDNNGWILDWDFPDVIHPQQIGMDMPKILNAGPVAARISFFAPISLLFFFAVLLILGAMKGIHLHPVNYFFLSAGFFAFQLLFAYLVDLLPLLPSFLIASMVSLTLVTGYIRAVAGKDLLKIALPAQIVYLVLFSYSFFFDGLSGIAITIGAIATLAILMTATAKTNWSELFKKERV